jgi:hypothetical protein
MKLDPSMHIFMHLVFFGKAGVTVDAMAQTPMVLGSPRGGRASDDRARSPDPLTAAA